MSALRLKPIQSLRERVRPFSTVAWSHGVIWKLLITGLAGSQSTLPGCAASMVHVRVVNNVASLAAFTVHTPVVCEVKVTSKLELAVALRT
jgi:hypothetical protein